VFDVAPGDRAQHALTGQTGHHRQADVGDVSAAGGRGGDFAAVVGVIAGERVHGVGDQPRVVGGCDRVVAVGVGEMLGGHL
jgi:hypothetical protein